MKVVTASEMARIEKMGMDDPAKEEEFMNRAGEAVAHLAQRMIAKYHLLPIIALLCGRGNNAGDCYRAGTILIQGGFRVKAFSVFSEKEMNSLCYLQSRRFLQCGGEITFIQRASEIEFSEKLLIDGLVGTGFKGELTGLLKETVQKANASHIPILSIDIPSGVNGTNGEIGTIAIQAKETLFLGMAKTGCFLSSAWNYVGKVHTFNFGLKEEHIQAAQEDFLLLDENKMADHLPSLQRVRHKYQAGYLVGLGGSPGMPGAPLLTSLAALRVGSGLVRLLHPSSMEAEFGQAPYELIRESYKETKEILTAMNQAHALFIGPGIGLKTETAEILKTIFATIDKPMVIDAQGLTLIAMHKMEIPKGAILTPHRGEMKRLLSIEGEIGERDLLKQTQGFAQEHQITIILKGAPTFIFHLDHMPSISPWGDPGMATAGTGDVLTGIVAGLLVQGKKPLEAAELGLYLHGKAGEQAAEELSSYSLIASDIIDALPKVFLKMIRAVPRNKALEAFS